MRFPILLGTLLLLSTSIVHADTLRCPARVTSMEMGKGEYSPMPGATFELQNFSAQMIARGKSSPLCFNRTTEIEHGQVFISSESLSHLFERKVEQSSSKIKDVKIEIKDNKAHLTGTMKKGLGVGFEIDGPVSTDGTVLMLKAEKIKAAKIPVKGLLGMVGKHLDDLLGAGMEGVKANDDTLIFVPESISHVKGRIAKAELTNAGLMLDFEGAAKKQQASSKGAKYQGEK